MVVLTTLGAVGCAAEPTTQPVTPDDTCLFRTDDAIAQVIAFDMKTLDSERAAAQACSTQKGATPLFPPAGTGALTRPTGPVPTATDVRTAYRAWLGSAANAIVGGGTPDPSASSAAQGINQYLQACPGGFHRPDCGTDVNCQRGEWAPPTLLRWESVWPGASGTAVPRSGTRPAKNSRLITTGIDSAQG